ncbi:exocyst complex component EXO70B1-like [Zingiber officinale]|uniref:Exocyst subunit Exo70 family protein n=1 Tax=Zingiber officinale TaxID=94328 RepID=A0A8J5FJQ7_ZINOF|nr:exocyst complex component EXO70B1-like [Zingiber officinale]XP_042422845.1 exocyst complex component EXO70B1-like [Zingiber officinale]KAG6488245.1 hypothetical protein ZIOFF_057004 [Zingiber officinale]
MASTPKADGSDNVIAAARHIVRSLATTSEAADDMMRILSAFDHRLSTVPGLFSSFPSGDEEDASGSPVNEVEPPSSCAEPSEKEARLKAAERVILHWDPSRPDSLLWDSPETAADYLAAVDEVIALAEVDSLDGAEETLQIAIARLGDEFRNLMIQNADVLDSENLQESIKRLSISFRSASANSAPEDVGESPPPDQPLATRVNTMYLSDEQIFKLICPEGISDLKDIADRMIKAGYRIDLCRVYTSIRCNILGDCLSLLGAGAVTNKEVWSMEWTALDHKMKMWIQAVKLSIGVMSAERQLCQQIIAASDDLREECFDEVAKFCVTQLLKFGDAIAEGQRSTERLFRMLDMYEALAGVLPDIQALFLGDSKDYIWEEIQSVLSRLGETIKNTLAEFGNMIQGDMSKKALPGGEIHPLNRYVMNYVRLLAEYSTLLNQLLEDGSFNGQDSSEGGESMTPLAHRVLLLISYLEANLEEKSKLYEDAGMQNVFLMNNVLYIVNKVKESDLMSLLGDNWVRRRRGQIRRYSTQYLRASWTKVLSCLKEEGLSGSSHGFSKTVLREKFKSFNLAFEEVYKIQSEWKVSDPQLRQELRISISEQVLPAYRAFLGRFGPHLQGGWHSGKYIKYTVEDLERCLEDFFEGLPLPSSYFRRKLSLP